MCKNLTLGPLNATGFGREHRTCCIFKDYVVSAGIEKILTVMVQPFDLWRDQRSSIRRELLPPNVVGLNHYFLRFSWKPPVTFVDQYLVTFVISQYQWVTNMIWLPVAKIMHIIKLVYLRDFPIITTSAFAQNIPEQKELHVDPATWPKASISSE